MRIRWTTDVQRELLDIHLHLFIQARSEGRAREWLAEFTAAWLDEYPPCEVCGITRKTIVTVSLITTA